MIAKGHSVNVIELEACTDDEIELLNKIISAVRFGGAIVVTPDDEQEFELIFDGEQELEE